MWGMCGTILEKEAICTGEGLNCEPDALRPPFRDLLGSCPSLPPPVGRPGPSWPKLALPQVAPWEGKGRASVWPAAADAA